LELAEWKVDLAQGENGGEEVRSAASVIGRCPAGFEQACARRRAGGTGFVARLY
jgi:hypothetical protein